MLVIPGATIHTLMQLMEDGKPFKSYMAQLEGSARYFFEVEFFHPSFAATKKQILKRLWGVLATPAFERMFAQRENKLDLFDAMNDGKIILISTAKDLLKTDGSALFGRFFVALIAQAVLERSAIPSRDRTPTFLYVDEAQEYFDDTVETILSQARKYRVGMTLAHQALDQLSPRLRAALFSNTSFKCVGGLSSKDARALAAELHTSTDFIEGMRKRHDRTEFAAWLKNRTPTALRLDVRLGHVERQPTMPEDCYDELIARNRERYCGTRGDILSFPAAPAKGEGAPLPRPSPATRVKPASEAVIAVPAPARASPSAAARVKPEAREQGKGGPKHRYLQSLVKGLAEQQGFRATIEAPLPRGAGQVDVLLEREGLAVAVEVSVTTPVAWEQENVRKCLAAGYGRVAVVLAKSRTTQGTYSPRNSLIASRCVLFPSDLGDFGDKGELIEALRCFIHRYVDLSPGFEEIATYYVLLTWVYDAFGELPYLRFRGDWGTGKTRALLTVGSLCYKPFFASGASTVSPIFHILDTFGGTLVLDEADLRFSDATAELTKILNNGTVAGLPVLRTMTNSARELNPRAFSVFGPKVLGMRTHFADAALESRFLTEETGQRALRPDVPIHVPRALAEEARALRNRLLAWRFHARHRVSIEPDRVIPGIVPRLNQTAIALLSIIDDAEARKRVSALLLAEADRWSGERAASVEHSVLGVMVELARRSPTKPVALADIAAMLSKKIAGADDAALSSRTVGFIVRTKLRLPTIKSRGVFVVPALARPAIDALAARYGISSKTEYS